MRTFCTGDTRGRCNEKRCPYWLENVLNHCGRKGLREHVRKDVETIGVEGKEFVSTKEEAEILLKKMMKSALEKARP